MFGSNLSDVRVNIIKNKPSRVDRVDYVNIQEDFYKYHKFMALTDDFIFQWGFVYYHIIKEDEVCDSQDHTKSNS